MKLATAEDVIRRAGVTTLPEYEDVSPMIDCAGFYAFRHYPADSQLAQIVTADRRPAVRCYLRFVIPPAAGESSISRVEVEVWFQRRWSRGRTFSTESDPYRPKPGDPNAPSPQSTALLARARIPIDLDPRDVGEFIYDHREDTFLDASGSVTTPAQILEQAYKKHCRTLRSGFRIRWKAGTCVRWLATRIVWHGQDAAMWALFNLYDVELADKELRESRLRDPYRKYKPSDFRRGTERPGERSHFFGFQSSQKSLFTNLSVVAITCLLLYWKAPLDGLLRTIYRNTALTTAALVLGFLLADKFGPWLLIGTICTLSRFREAALFFVRKVRV